MANDLGKAASAYLRSHAHQDIDWRTWDEDAFARAAQYEKPILVSVGYLACFWCHVMAEEAFSDARVVDVINRDFVAIKVDREEHPDVDRSILDALAKLGARTGWPATAFMTPKGEVFAGGSYFPTEPRHGLPGFLDVLAQAGAQYQRGEFARGDTSRPQQAPSRRERSAIGDIETYATFLGDRLLENVDRIYGGFGQNGPRFPQVSLHELLWRRHAMTGSAAFGSAVADSLTRICRSALCDHVGGGFHRYCVDDAWTVPHFEKMLYDNAQLIELLTWVYRGTRAPVFKERVEEAIGWAIREMLVDDVGFASSIGAHANEGISETRDSGRFYRWRSDELAEALGSDAGLFARLYEISPMGDEPSGALQQTDRRARDDAERERLAACKALLLRTRDQREKPARDDKIMADWNGLMIVALIEAGSALDRRDWLALAGRVFDRLVEVLSDGPRLHHCVTKGRKGPTALLEDYAAMARAALRLYEAFGKPRYLDLAKGWVEVLFEDFWDEARGGFFMSAASSWQPGARTRTITETSLPSGNAVMIGVLARLHELTAIGAYRDRAEALAEGFHDDIVRHGMAAATAVNNVGTLARFVRISLAGRPRDDETREMLGIALDCCLPDRMVLGPAAGADAPAEGARAQVCIGTTCLLPITSTAVLRKLLSPGGFVAEAAS